MENKNNMELAKDFLKESFTSKGRWNRQRYWLSYLLLITLLIPVFLIAIWIMMWSNLISIIFLSIWLISFSYISILAIIKRLHDLDKNPWLVLLLFIPYINFYLFLICGFFKGTEGPNKFGTDPLSKNNTEKKEENKTSEL
jgi:uncharacterized membrane protein YhaH (DUF805 family)